MPNRNVALQRLHNQHLTKTSFTRADEVAKWMVASQAQDYAGAKWALGLRMQGATDAVIDQAFADGSILRTHLLRPTWHFVTPTDIRWLLALTAPHVHAVNAYMYRKLELDNAIFKRSQAVFAKALQGGKQLARDELREELQKVKIATAGELRLGYLLMHAELNGLICSGARRGKQFTYTLLDERAPQTKILERDEALAELAKRYFASRGPATMQDFSKWSGLTLTDAKHSLEAVKDQFDYDVVNEQTYWFAPSSSFRKAVAPRSYLLSIFDEYISSYKDHGAINETKVGAKLKAMGNDLTYIIVLNGQIVGTWKRTIKKREVVIKTNLLVQLTPTENQAVAAAVQRYGEFLELPTIQM